MSAAKRFEEALELELRVISVVDLASAIATDALEGSVPDDLEDLLESLREDEATLHASMDQLAEAVADCAHHESELLPDLLQLRSILGIALCVATPARTHSAPSSWWSGWGVYRTGWVYGSTFDVAWEHAKAWAEAEHARDLADFSARQGAPA